MSTFAILVTIMKRLFGAAKAADFEAEARALRIEAERARVLVEQSREIVVVLDNELHVVASSRRAREEIEGLAAGRPLPSHLLAEPLAYEPVLVPYEIDGRRETLVYLGEAGDLSTYEELRAGFTAAVSHELRTPLARLLALLETAALPGEDPTKLLEQGRREVEHMRELIDDVLFLSELETGRATVSLGLHDPEPVLEEVAEELRESADRAGVVLAFHVESGAVVPLRPRMLRMIVENLAENAVRYAGSGATLTLSVAEDDGDVVVTASDDGVGVEVDDLPRLFERFYRSDRVRASRGTGLGLAIVKHVVTAAGGSIEATGTPGHGLTIKCRFRRA
jgi:two-component system, OmpR family, phosphate regulon sensor histidine kinase PhoR